MPEQVQRIIRVTTTQHINTNKPPIEEKLPFRDWSIKITVLGPNGQELPANIFDKVTYKLHPTFENPTREEEGWGEFDMAIVVHFADRGGEQLLSHDLNFAQNVYTVDHTLSFPVNRPGLAKLLAESGPVPGISGPSSTEIGDKRKLEAGDVGNPKLKKKSRTFEKASVDLERLADGLQKLSEDDLLGVVQMVTDNKTPEMYIKNDVDEGEFHMDLYTLPESLLKSLWDYVKKRTDI